MKKNIKKIYFVLILFLAVLDFSQAQQAGNIDSPPKWYKQTLRDSAVYAASQKDTLPSTVSTLWATNSGTLKLGGANLLTLSVRCKDSMRVFIYLDYRARAINGTAGAWTNVYVDSIVTATNTGTNVEKVLRSTSADNIGQFINAEYRIVFSFQADYNGATSPRYWAYINWK